MNSADRSGIALRNIPLLKKLLAKVEDRPWQRMDEAELGPARDIPSMLGEEELRFYHWLSRQMSDVQGAVVDLGSFVGGSTAHLAEGARAGGATDKQVYAFDHFAATEKVKEKQLYAKGVEPFEGDNILQLSQQYLSPWAPNITFRQGRIEGSRWREGPISMLVLDASKTTSVTDRIARLFFPSLIPGRSVIVQQDELHWKEPWISAQMQRLEAYFAPICHVPGNTMAYVTVKRIGPMALHRARVAGLSDRDLIDDLHTSSIRLKAFGVAPQIERQAEAVRLNPGKRKAWRFRKRPPRRTPREVE
ncbi:MAG: class I SAM-dependent methyltransferase [Pseudomonadota bacterium]